MRLYYEDEVLELCEQAREERLAATAMAPVIAERKAAEAAARKLADETAARHWGTDRVDVYPHGDAFPLPHDTLEIVMRKLGESVEPDGVRGPGIVARDICNAAAACKALRAAAPAAFAAVKEKCGATTDCGDAMLHHPMTLKHGVLKEVARARGCLVTGTKGELVMRVLRSLRLTSPPSAATCFAGIADVADERQACLIPNRLSTVLQRLRIRQLDHPCLRTRHRSLAEMRIALSGHFPTIVAFESAVAHMPEPVRRVAIARSVPRVCGGQNCACVQTPASACTKGMCNTCCSRAPGACARHQVM